MNDLGALHDFAKRVNALEDLERRLLAFIALAREEHRDHVGIGEVAELALYGAAPVVPPDDLIAKRLEAAENAVEKLVRFVFPLIMELEQAEMIANDEGKTLDEATVVLSFMGSGASDRSTLFDYHEARRANDALHALRIDDKPPAG